MMNIRNVILASVLLVAIYLLSGCEELGITGSSIAIPSERGNIDAYFCQKDNCTEALMGFLDTAEGSIHCALFDTDLEEVAQILDKKSEKIDVKVVVDADNKKDVSIKKAKVRYDDDNQLTHNKFCIVDNSKIFTGSFNPTYNGAYKNDNNMLLIDSSILASNYEDEFDELWNYEFGKGQKVKNPVLMFNGKEIENYFCPEDDCKGKVINALNKAEKSIYFMTFSFTDEDIADAILYKHDLDIKGVFEKMQAGSQYSQYHRFLGFGLDVKKDSNPAMMHHKVFIVDNSTVITGSFNPTGSGNFKNDENILIIHYKDIADKFVEEFERVY